MNWGELTDEQLLQLATSNSADALEELFRRYREPLRRMLATRMDIRLQSRIDVSDIIQETFIEAHRRLEEYCQDDQPIAFLPWLRQIANNRMIDAYRHHILAKRREVDRQNDGMPAAGESGHDLIDLQAGSLTTPSEALERKEIKQSVRDALHQLEPTDQEIIIMRHLKRLTTRETAEALAISEAAVKLRLLRALQRLRTLLETHGHE